MTLWHWIVAAASLTGVLLNIRRRRESFAIWFGTNSTWCVIDATAGLHAQATLMGVYAGLAVWGYRAWRPVPAPPAPS